MRKAILGAASALALASPAVAADLQVTPYSENPGYEQEVPPYAYGTAPPYAYGAAPPVIVAPPPVVVYEYPVYVAPPMYAYAGPVRFGVADGDGAIEVTSAAVGKVPDM
jgi:opacity protein-like surface antigen